MASYTILSPWYETNTQQDYLDILTIRPVSAEPDDFLYTIESQYMYRPDLLAFDLYGEAGLWWVFMQRNMDVIEDPIFDFVPGKKIYIPKGSSLRTVLGV
jgi:alpha-L-fucosidase